MRILCVCHGNICRSPMAETILDREFQTRGLTDWVVDSVGTSSEEVGNPTDPRTLDVLRMHNIILDHTARQINHRDFEQADYILIMDEYNRRNLERTGASEVDLAKVHLVTEYDPEGATDVPDPYHLDIDGFHETYRVLNRSLKAFLDDVSK